LEVEGLEDIQMSLRGEMKGRTRGVCCSSEYNFPEVFMYKSSTALWEQKRVKYGLESKNVNTMGTGRVGQEREK
jgi:hypothetical protein